MTQLPEFLPESLTVALQLHRSRRLAEAESVYRQRLKHQPITSVGWVAPRWQNDPSVC